MYLKRILGRHLINALINKITHCQLNYKESTFRKHFFW